MANLFIDEVTPSKSGKAWRVKSGGKWYGAFGDSGIEGHVGKTIDAEITTSEKYGLGISKYKIVAPEASTQAQRPLPASGPNWTTPTSTTGGEMRWLPMASNTVNAAIGAGLIKEHSQIKVWVLAVKEAVEGAASGDVGF